MSHVDSFVINLTAFVERPIITPPNVLRLCMALQKPPHEINVRVC
uniref:Uncharacterized protein n=1 Tax=Anguilla anguilla TaxID=7936 RepID=A0A0E9RPI2_ANGAN